MKFLKSLLTSTLILAMLLSFAGCLDEVSDKQTSSNDTTFSASDVLDEMPEPTENPTPTPTEKPTPAPTAKPTKKPSEAMVWIPTKGGKKYHSKSTCSNMDSPDQVTKSEAVSLGFTACGKCYK